MASWAHTLAQNRPPFRMLGPRPPGGGVLDALDIDCHVRVAVHRPGSGHRAVTTSTSKTIQDHRDYGGLPGAGSARPEPRPAVGFGHIADGSRGTPLGTLVSRRGGGRMSQMRHRAGIQADDLVLHTTQAVLPIGHQPRHERAVTIPKGTVQPDWSDIGIDGLRGSAVTRVPRPSPGRIVLLLDPDGSSTPHASHVPAPP